MATNEVSILKFGSTEYSVKDDTGTASNHKHTKSQITDFPDISGKADLADIAPEFSTSKNYKIGDIVSYSGDIYMFKANHSAAAWNNTHVTQIVISSYLANSFLVTSGRGSSSPVGQRTTIEGRPTNIVTSNTYYSHIEGNNNEITGDGYVFYTHIEGDANELDSSTDGGEQVHIEGKYNTARASHVHVEGFENEANARYSHVSGVNNIANGTCQTVIGQYNEADTFTDPQDQTDHALIIGNGTSDNARSNALTVDWDGNLEAAGNVIANGKIKVSNGTSGNLAGFDTNGYIIDSGSKASDFAASSHTHTKSQITDFPSSMTPTSHASSATTYGTGTTSNYGHVKLATGDMNGASNVNGVACSKNHTHSQYLTSITTDQSISAHPASVETEFSRYMVLKNGVKLCWGNRVINQDDESSYELYTTFPITFSSKPTVFLCPHVDSESSYLIASIGNDISTSGFWIKKHAKYPGVFKFSEGSPDVYWFAIGV